MGLAAQGQFLIDQNLEKQLKAELKAIDKIHKNEAKALRAEKFLGPRRKVLRSNKGVVECHHCLDTYPEGDGADIGWLLCSFCDRCSCSNPECIAAWCEHEPKCKMKQFKREEAHQAAKLEAPRQQSILNRITSKNDTFVSSPELPVVLLPDTKPTKQRLPKIQVLATPLPALQGKFKATDDRLASIPIVRKKQLLPH